MRSRGASGSSAYFLLALVLVVLPVANTHVGFPYASSRLPGDESAWTTHRLFLIAGHALLVLSVVLWARRRTDFSLRLKSGSVVGTATLAVLTLAVGWLVLQKPLEPQLELLDYGSFSRTAQLLSVTGIVWAGLGQEILFRAFAIQIIEDQTDSTITAIFLTSVAFGYYHGGFSLGAGNLLANVLGGVLLGLIFAKTRNTWAATVPHALLVALLLAVA